MTGLRKAILRVARTYLDTPFHHTGRTKTHGVDCVGLVAGVSQALNLSDFDRIGYSRWPGGTAMLDGLRAAPGFTELASADLALPGDVLVFWISPRSKAPQHIGILTEDGGLIHTHAGAGCVVETGLGSWSKRITHAFRFPAVEERWQP